MLKYILNYIIHESLNKEKELNIYIYILYLEIYILQFINKFVILFI